MNPILKKMIEEKVQQQLEAFANKEAEKIVADIFNGHAPDTNPTVIPVFQPAMTISKKSKRMYIPRGSWLAVGATKGIPTGAKAREIYSTISQLLSNGPAPRSTIMDMLYEQCAANNHGGRQSALSSQVSDLIRRGFLSAIPPQVNQ